VPDSDAGRPRSRCHSGFSFAPDPICAVARPFSGDVVDLDTGSFKVKWIAQLGGQPPLEVAALRDREVVARDWKTGAVARGTLRRRWFARRRL